MNRGAKVTVIKMGVIHFELTLADFSYVPEDCLWQAQWKSSVLQLAIKVGNHYSFKDERR